jgi:O-acetyl-ADP-ribose deacetylase (regulator of RNase III)
VSVSGHTTLRVLQADITTLHVDVIVNAANRSLLGGGGVDGAVHAAAGPELFDECRRRGGCDTGKAKITRGYCLPARWIIHTVGPEWHGGFSGEAVQLASCYRSAIEIADRYAARSIAFPAISTGVYGFPKSAAANIAVRAVRSALVGTSAIEEVVFCCFSEQDAALYEGILFPEGPQAEALGA